MNWGDVPIRGTHTTCCRNTTPHWMNRDDFGEWLGQKPCDGRMDQRNPAYNSHEWLLTSLQAPVAELGRVQTPVRILTNPATIRSRSARSANAVCRRAAIDGSPAFQVLMLRCLGLPKINGAKTKGIITTRRVSEGFAETLVKCESSIPH